MDKATKEKALGLLAEKKSNLRITYADTELKTGYSRRQLIRFSKRLDVEAESDIMTHGNSKSRPSDAAAEAAGRDLQQ